MNHLFSGSTCDIQVVHALSCIMAVVGREHEDTGNGSECPSGFMRLLTRHPDALEEVILEFESKRGPVSNRVKKIAALAGAAGGAYLAARAMSVREGLTSPREPFLWKPPRENSVLLRGVNLIDVVRGRTLKDRGLLFKDGMITGLVPTRDLEKVEADISFDCEGLFVMPGLINAHCHTLLPGSMLFDFDSLMTLKRQAYRNLEECAVHGVTTVRDAMSLPLILNRLIRRIESLDLLGPRIITCGSAITVKGGYPEHVAALPAPLSEKWGDPVLHVTGPGSAREAVRKAVEIGGRYIKLFFDDRSFQFGNRALNTIDDESVKAILDEAHELGRRVGVHQTQIAGFRRAVKLAVDDLEHVPYDAVLTDEDVERFIEGDHHLTPTSSADMALSMVPKGHPLYSNPLIDTMNSYRERVFWEIVPAFAEEAVVRSDFKTREIYRDGDFKRGLTTRILVDPELMAQAIVNGSKNVQKLYEAGATICCGNDGGTPMVFPGSLFTEMQILDWLGLSRADVLRSATTNSASLLGLDRDIGSLEKGKLADLLVLSGNPLEDVRAVENVEAVFRSGVLLHRGPGFSPVEDL